jgi:L-ascorbate metabolism protein UlaG (beta-lactamase superfamily)
MKKKIAAVLFLLLVFIPGSLIPAKKQVTFTWYGQSCFLMVTTGNTRIITDPVVFKGYTLPGNIRADIVTVSHEHVDHNKVSAISGNPEVLRGWDTNGKKIKEIDKKIKDVRIYTVASYHDKARIGLNAIFIFEFDGLRIAHLGDLGLTLSGSQVKASGEIDILMLPVGGQFTISGAEADTVVKQLNVKRIVFPMHFKTAAADFLPYSADDFTKGKQKVKKIAGNTFILDLDNLRQDLEYIVLDYGVPTKGAFSIGDF